jgi:hypothetical protein
MAVTVSGDHRAVFLDIGNLAKEQTWYWGSWPTEHNKLIGVQ